MPPNVRSASARNARARLRSLSDPFAGLFPTHDLGVVAASLDPDDLFPDRTIELTFAAQILTTGAEPGGLIFEFGSATNGAKLGVSEGALYVAAGNGTDATATGVDGSAAFDALEVSGQRLDLVLGIRPAVGQARLWVNGDLALRLDAVASTPMLNDVWSDADLGSVGAAEAGTGSTQRGVVINGAPADFVLSAPLRVSMGMTPRGWDG